MENVSADVIRLKGDRRTVHKKGVFPIFAESQILSSTYSSIKSQVDTHTHSILKKSKGLQQIRNYIQKNVGGKNLDLPGTFLCDPFLLFFKITFQITSEQKRYGRFGFASSNALVQMSRVLLRCLSSLRN